MVFRRKGSKRVTKSSTEMILQSGGGQENDVSWEDLVQGEALTTGKSSMVLES